MRFLKVAAATAAAFSMASAPVMAQTRADDDTRTGAEERGVNSMVWVVLFAALAVFIGIALSGDNNNSPVSP